MKTIFLLLLALLITSCASEKQNFNVNKTCSNESIKYLRNPRNQTKRYLDSPYLASKIASTKGSMQSCYNDFKKRSGLDDDFNTCLVVGIDESGLMDFYNFSSNDVRLDQKFIDCAINVTAGVDFSSYGWNYILVQTYKFYEDE